MNGRLIFDAAAVGSWNMAIDAAILESLRPDGPITLRFYTWSKPTVSLGYFQTLHSHRTHLWSQGADVVRRSTGGGAIVHDRELTYSLAVPIADRSPASSRYLYQLMHRSIAEALGEFGVVARRWGVDQHLPRHEEPFLCFQRRTAEDLVVSGYKVVGSAQRRGHHGVLQHGSILLLSSSFAPELPGCFDLRGGTRWEKNWAVLLSERIADRVGQSLSLGWTIGTATNEELNIAKVVEVERFCSPSWHARC